MDVNPMTPITSVKVLKSVPLDKSYKDTLDFSSVSSQIDYFSSKTKYTFTNLTPIRLQNAIRLPITADKLYECNYLMFQNANFSNKWFYAFITEIKFIGVNICEVYFEIDVLQTWQFDITIKPSFVEREHTNNDTIGSNIIAENLELGEYVINSNIKTSMLNELWVLLGTTVSIGELTPVTGGAILGVYSGIRYYAYPLSNIADINTTLQMLVAEGKADAIISVSMIPRCLLPLGSSGGMISNPVIQTHDIVIDKINNLDGYTPKNNKLLTYPYCLLSVINHQGNHAEYYQEYFTGGQANFTLTGNIGADCTCVLYPKNYKGAESNLNEMIQLGNFPQCSYNTDTFKIWLAQNTVSQVISGVSNGVTIVGGAMSGNPFAITGGVIGIANQLATVYQHSILPPQARGNINGSGVNVAIGSQNFEILRLSIREEYARIIDEFFSAYGYATHRVKVPNIKGRASWNYVKTIDSKVVGSIPFGDIEKIRTILDNGVTFWHGDYVGDYTRNNPII